MKLVRFEYQGVDSLGALADDNTVVNLTASEVTGHIGNTAHRFPLSMSGFLARGQEGH